MKDYMTTKKRLAGKKKKRALSIDFDILLDITSFVLGIGMFIGIYIVLGV